MPSGPALNCSDALANPPLLTPNPDVSGIGVLVGFLATAYTVWILLIVHYILFYDPAKAGLTDANHPINYVDALILNFIWKKNTRPPKIWEEGLEKMVLIMSDQQMITGIALLCSALSQLPYGISAYHWQMTIYLVWFSSFTHLATLTFLRRYLHKHPPMRFWRLFFMTALISLLVAALIPTGNKNWLPSGQPNMSGVPTTCFYHYSSISSNEAQMTSMLFSILVLCISYTTRAIKLYEWSSKASRLVLRTLPGNAIKRYLDKLYAGIQNTRANKWILSIPYNIILCMLLTIRSWMDLLESMFWEITWLMIALIWGTLRLFATRNTTIDQNEDILEENSWGFGQCLAAAMFVLLIFSAIETYIETKIIVGKAKNSNSSASSIYAGGVEQGVVLSRSPTNSLEPRHSAETLVDTTALGDADIADVAIAATGADELFQAVARSPTSLSSEERSLGTSFRRRNTIQPVDGEIELQESSHTNPMAPAPTVQQQTLPPHKRIHYNEQWYKSLVIYNFSQVLLLSGGILSSAYDMDGSDFVGPFGSVRDVGKMVLFLINWVFLYSPFSSFIVAFLCVNFKGRMGYDVLFSSFSFFMYIDICLFFIYGVFVTLIPFIPPFMFTGTHGFWEDILPGGSRFLLVWAYGISCVVYFLWYWIISFKLKREGI